jgi:hypothetical protein
MKPKPKYDKYDKNDTAAEQAEDRHEGPEVGPPDAEDRAEMNEEQLHANVDKHHGKGTVKKHFGY